MKKVNIRELFQLKQNQMLESFNLNSAFEHSVTKGDATEKEWRKWFNENFPQRYKAEKAFVIDYQGNCSEQMDIVIYDTHFSPIIFENNGEKYIPAESVYAVFEVKQDLTKEQILYAIKKIKSVKQLIRTSAPVNTINGFVNGRLASTIIGGLLTIKSGWKLENIEENLVKTLQENIKSKAEEIDFICCLSYYACAIENKSSASTFCGKDIYIYNFDLVTDSDIPPLLFTYLKLLRMLQDAGNVPAIEFDKYGIKGIDYQSKIKPR